MDVLKATAPHDVQVGKAGDTLENPDALIASVTLTRVGSLLNELNIALPVLKKVLGKVVPTKRTREADTEDASRPSKRSAEDTQDITSESAPRNSDGETEVRPESLGIFQEDVAEKSSKEKADEPSKEEAAPIDVPTESNFENLRADAPSDSKHADLKHAESTAGLIKQQQNGDIPASNGQLLLEHSAILAARTSEDARGGLDSDELLLDRTSDVLLTLSALGRLRGGRPVTRVESNLMAEAYENVYLLASKLAPKQLVTKEGVEEAIASLGLRAPEENSAKVLAPVTPKAANQVLKKVSPSVAAINAVAAQVLSQSEPQKETAMTLRTSERRIAQAAGAGPSSSAQAPPQTPALASPPMRFGPPLAGQVTSHEAAAIALAAGQGKVLTELDKLLRASVQPPMWLIGVPNGLPDRKEVQKKIEAFLRDQQQFLTQFQQVEAVDKHVASKQEEVQQQLVAYSAQERELEGQSLLLLGEVQSKLAQLRQQSSSLQTHQQQLAKAKKQVIQKHLAMQQEKQILATAPFLTPRSAVEFPVTCPVCGQEETATANLIVCDICEKGYHTRCAVLPSTPPFGYDHDWICPLCKAQALRTQAPPLQGGAFPARASPLGVLAASLGASVSAAPRVRAESGPWSRPIASQQEPVSQWVAPDLLASVGTLRSASPQGAPNDVSKTSALEQRPTGHEKAVALAPPADVSMTSAQRIAWLGEGLRQEDGSVHYRECVVSGRTYRVGDTVELRSDGGADPFVGRIQAFWDDPSSKQQRMRVNWCYVPSDIPAQVAKPETSGVREVYESNHGDENPVGSILGPCLLLPQQAFESELERRRSAGIGTVEIFPPLYLCNWMYDARVGKFMLRGQVA